MKSMLSFSSITFLVVELYSGESSEQDERRESVLVFRGNFAQPPVGSRHFP